VGWVYVRALSQKIADLPAKMAVVSKFQLINENTDVYSVIIHIAIEYPLVYKLWVKSKYKILKIN